MKKGGEGKGKESGRGRKMREIRVRETDGMRTEGDEWRETNKQ